MSASQAWPDLADKSAVRAWIDARRDSTEEPPPRTSGEFRMRQLRKLGRALSEDKPMGGCDE